MCLDTYLCRFLVCFCLNMYSLGSDVSSCQENGNISLSNNDRKSPSETGLLYFSLCIIL